jgi:hypothetical protein
MKIISEIFLRNKLLAIAGSINLILAILLVFYAPFNNMEVLGLNSMIKPIKFLLSLWIYFWTMAYLLFYLENQVAVARFSMLAVLVMFYENGVIVVQAFRGKLSHFNQSELVGGILYGIMGVLIVTVTLATALITIRFIRQKTYSISPEFALSIKIGLVFFIIFSFMGGYMSAINSHNIGGNIGQEGLPLLNWSTLFGDLRVAHFFGIHSLQLIPLFGYFIDNKEYSKSSKTTLIWLFAMLYFAFISFTLWQAVQAKPFI